MREKINSYLSRILILAITFSVIIFVENNYSQQMPLADKQTNREKREKLFTQDLKELNKVKKLKVKERSRYSAGYSEDGKLSDSRTLMETIYYNEDGNRTDHELYKRGTIVENLYSYEYDSTGNVIKLESYNEYEFVVFKRESKYDNNGNEIERLYSEAKSRGESRAVMKYNNNNDLTEVLAYDPKGNLNSTVTLTYENGILKNTVTKDKNGQLLEESNLEYDSNGDIIREIVTNGKDTVAFTYKYNSDGYVTEIKYSDSIRYLDYDDEGNIIEDKRFFISGEREYKVRFIYNEQGLLKEEIRYAANDSPNFYSEFRYEFYK